MALPSTGTISWSQIQAVMGGTNPVSLSEYYANATPSYTTGIPGIPNIGTTLSLSMFAGKAKFTVNYAYTYSTVPYVPGDTNNTSIIWKQVVSGYWSGIGTPSWLCDTAPYNQAGYREYEYIYYSSSTSDVSVRFQFQCDNACNVLVNGSFVGSSSDWTFTTTATGTLKYGNNRILIQSTNADPGGAGGAILTCSRLSNNAVLFVTNSSWRMS